MTKCPGIDYSRRPASYWVESDVLSTLLRDVKGTERRKMIRHYFEEGRLEELDPTLLRGALSEEVRKCLGRIHPMFMGGEFLPDCGREEVEVARVELRSVTSDVISIRAQRRSGRIHYRVVDEYGTEFVQPQRSSARPLALGKLVRFIGCTWEPNVPHGLPFGYNELNLETARDRRQLRHFTRIRSDSYPQLEEHFENVFEEWVREGERQMEKEAG